MIFSVLLVWTNCWIDSWVVNDEASCCSYAEYELTRDTPFLDFWVKFELCSVRSLKKIVIVCNTIWICQNCEKIIHPHAASIGPLWAQCWKFMACLFRFHQWHKYYLCNMKINSSEQQFICIGRPIHNWIMIANCHLEYPVLLMVMRANLSNGQTHTFRSVGIIVNCWVHKSELMLDFLLGNPNIFLIKTNLINSLESLCLNHWTWSKMLEFCNIFKYVSLKKMIVFWLNCVLTGSKLIINKSAFVYVIP